MVIAVSDVGTAVTPVGASGNDGMVTTTEEEYEL